MRLNMKSLFRTLFFIELVSRVVFAEIRHLLPPLPNFLGRYTNVEIHFPTESMKAIDIQENLYFKTEHWQTQHFVCLLLRILREKVLTHRKLWSEHLIP